MNMTIGRRLAEAVGSWLHLEFCCYRAGLLSEGALKAAVGQVLSSFPISTKGARVYAEYAHEALNPVKRVGRKKEVDFALVLSGVGLAKTMAEVLVEAKWANSSHCTPTNIFSDFLRLAALKKADPDAKCLFLLAGHTREMAAIKSGLPFNCGDSPNTGIIRTGKRQKRLTPMPWNSIHRQAWKTTINDLLADGLMIPESFVVSACDAHPIQSELGTVDFQAQCWEITVVSDKNIRSADWL